MKTRLFGVLALVGLVGVLSTTSFAAGQGHTQTKKTITIGVSLAGYSTDFWSSYVAFEKAAAAKNGVSLVGPISADGDAGKQATQIKSLIDQGVSALIINPVDSAAIAPTLAYAASKHVPVVSVDVAPTQGKVYMIVRADNVLYGQNACTYIASHVRGSGHVAMLEGDLASINGLDRKNGFLSCMKAHPNLKVVQYATKWDTPTAVNDAKTALSQYSDLKADLRPLERAGAGDHRRGEGRREVHERRRSEPHRPLQRRRNAAGAQLDPSGSGGRDDLAARDAVRPVRGVLRQAGGQRRQVPGRHEDRPREQDRAAAREPRGRDRGPGRVEGERQRPEVLGELQGQVSTLPERDSGRLPVQPPAARADGVWKSFGRMVALADVSLSVQGGECHALVGRNGAGKSTLVGVLTGLLKPDRGAVDLYGEPAPGPGDRAAWQQRVACVYQRSMVIPTLSVAENIFLNRNEGSLVHWRSLRKQARELLLEWGFDLDVDQPAGELSVEQKQIVEIARALSTGARFLILDEPTASLESSAIDRLFDRVRRLKENGVAILYISHHLEEIYEICDSVTVLRDGKRIVTAPVADLDHDRLVSAMVGSDPRPFAGHLRPERRRGSRSARGLGVVRSIATRRRARHQPRRARGRVRRPLRASRLGGSRRRRRRCRPPQARCRHDLARRGAAAHRQGRLHSCPRGRVRPRGSSRAGFRADARCAREPDAADPRPSLAHLRGGAGIKARSAAAPIAERLQIVSSGLEQPVAELSGGNQQKVVVGRAFASAPALLVVISPTVGVDVASKEALLGAIDDARRDGTAVLLVSDDLDEIRICTRVLVIRRGTVVREFTPPWERQTLISVAEGFGAAA